MATPAKYQGPSDLLIDGAWVGASGGARFEILDPATGEVFAHAADATPDDGARALAAAAAAGPAWRAVAPRERSELLRAVYERVIERSEEFAALITAEGGKPLAESRAEVDYGTDFVRWYAEQAVRLSGGNREAPAGGARQLISRRPVGPTLLITPWNFPLAMATRKIAPALAAGCTVVVKAASATPLTTALFAEVVRAELAARGLPTGVINLVATSDSGSLITPMLKSPALRKVSFTGSTAVGQGLLRAAADRVLRTSMELGGNAPFLVYGDADLDAAVEGALAAKMRNAGQTCVAANRFYAHESVAADFTARLTTAFAGMAVGPGDREGVQVGPLINASGPEKMAKYVQTALDDGAHVTTGGDAPDGPGYFYSPTVLGGVPADSELLRTEIFGPVAPVTTFSSDAEALALANDTDAGLVAYAYTRDLSRAMSLGEELEAGMIGINRGMVSDASAPFGGVKSSGLGREGGEAGIEEYLETVYVAL